MIVEAAPAKLNLALHVRGRRADGYHELETLFAFVRDGDEIRLADGNPGLSITGPFAGGLSGEGDNLVLRAARVFAERFGGALPSIELVKNLPVASGIGGGSADAAATLRALARRDGISLDDPRLFDCADALGSDVPACLLGVTAIGRGRGERLEPRSGWAGTPVLLVNPGVAVSTAEVFRRWDGEDRGPIPENFADGRNDLEAPAREIAPVVSQVLELLASTSATLARMSGSGATCFALYADAPACAAAGEKVRLACPAWWCLETALT